MDFVLNQKVSTPYGPGKVIKVREFDYVVEPSSWRLAAGQKPTFFMNPKDVQPFFQIGDNVKCSFGSGQIIDYNEKTNIYVVTLLNWKLATGKSPTLFLNDESMAPEEMTAAAKAEKEAVVRTEQMLLEASVLKEEAKELYCQRKYEEAVARYHEVNARLQISGDSIGGLQRARFLDVCITNNSNLALCYWNLNNFPECVTFAKNAVTLLDALEGQVGRSELWKNLAQLGYSEEKLADLKLKALRIKGKSEVKRGNFDEAKQNFEGALKLSRSEKVTKELDDLLIDVVKRRSSEKKKEKAVWQKAFSKRSAEAEEDLPAAPSTPVTKQSPSKKKASASNAGVIAKPSSFMRNALWGGLGLGLVGIGLFWFMRGRHFK